jgi:hypothetical protein
VDAPALSKNAGLVERVPRKRIKYLHYYSLFTFVWQYDAHFCSCVIRSPFPPIFRLVCTQEAGAVNCKAVNGKDASGLATPVNVYYPATSRYPLPGQHRR